MPLPLPTWPTEANAGDIAFFSKTRGRICQGVKQNRIAATALIKNPGGWNEKG